jgi:hypothetical protein
VLTESFGYSSRTTRTIARDFSFDCGYLVSLFPTTARAPYKVESALCGAIGGIGLLIYIIGRLSDMASIPASADVQGRTLGFRLATVRRPRFHPG